MVESLSLQIYKTIDSTWKLFIEQNSYFQWSFFYKKTVYEKSSASAFKN